MSSLYLTGTSSLSNFFSQSVAYYLIFLTVSFLTVLHILKNRGLYFICAFGVLRNVCLRRSSPNASEIHIISFQKETVWVAE